MRVAFYAPLKSPDHPTPSGDRHLARILIEAMRMKGHEVSVASHFRSFDRTGDAARQARLAKLGARLANRLLQRYQRNASAPELWFTYHLWHKAPDFLGPRISAALDIPYVVAEASIAPKQRHGPWASGYEHALQAVRQADRIIALNPVDIEQVDPVRGAGRSAQLLPPFVDASAYAAPAARRANAIPQLVTVAMMREGRKLDSYRVLAAALALLLDLRWRLLVVGDGSARPQVEAAFAPLPPDRVRFAGLCSPAETATLLRESDIFVWPAVAEILGMVFLEAQATGLPVVAGDAGGVSSVVAAGRTGILVPEGDVDAVAAATRRLIVDDAARAAMGREAPLYVRERHDLPVAAARLDALLQETIGRRARSSV
jgi:glycosyltransferase involved in cell wall biosynthesis